MDHGQFADLAAACHRAVDPLHAMLYFAPEAEEELTGIGLHRGRMSYFASRAAPMGPVGAGTVTATFYNFNPQLVAKHIPHAWTLASPEQVIDARYRAAGAALRRLLGEAATDPEVAEAAELAREATRGCTPEGRPLYAAHADLDWPSDPVLVLWHAITLLREFRGDGHVAALVDSGLDGLSALITHTATGRGFTESAAQATRGWSADEWETTVRALQAEGVLDSDRALTEQGAAQRDRIEVATNNAASAPWIHLGADGANRLREICRGLSKRITAAGAFPAELFGGN
ncbi:hypothetical protein H0B56_21710 [Haloechinothrix sp. YIM 98757]|uniref:SalK n=1 Tax=Haloechinothrix aidingensis TaxID=2752311 RepID=A0A838AG40_9PSEU|nr:hypothetical protein [Haloechinothrix aidingensis]MBA0128171.1 hypothetical protein [Haloechinothrix aidingensis]